MKLSILLVVGALGLLLGSTAFAQQSSAPAGSTGQCKDGSYSSTAGKRGACRGHKGVKEWYAAAAARPVKSAPAAVAAPAAAAPMKTGHAMPTPAANAAGGGGAGKVWVNGKVYHCSSDKWYGKTKHGEYMSESAAEAAGAHAAHGKACST